MPEPVSYSRGERVALVALAVVGIVAINTAYIYCLVFHWDLVVQAHTNPISVAFIAEALLLVGFLAYLLRKWGVLRLPWGWVVVLSLLGSLAFALPVVLLWPRKEHHTPRA